jgi:AcrR family transcriptional regulator
MGTAEVENDEVGVRVDPRVARTRQTALRGATEILAEGGYSAFSIEAVVERTGIAKTTLYRQWPSRNHLLHAVIAHLDHTRPLPDTGSIRTDLLEFLSRRARGARSTQWERCIPALIDAAARHPELAATIATLTAAVLEQIATLLRRGVDRGELRDDLDPPLAASMLIGPIVFRRLLLQDAPNPPLAEAIIDSALRGMMRPTG